MNLKDEYISIVNSVKEYMKKQNRPHRNEDIANLLGYGKSHFATLVGKTGKVSEQHLKDIKLHFPEIFENQTFKNNKKTSGNITLPVNQYELSVLLHRVAYLMAKDTGNSEVVELKRIEKDAELLRRIDAGLGAGSDS